jgi:hypothetical protein
MRLHPLKLTLSALLSFSGALLFKLCMLDDLYWVMSYSRWKDERFWPAFSDALRREHPILTEEALHKAKEFNSQRSLRSVCCLRAGARGFAGVGEPYPGG